MLIWAASSALDIRFLHRQSECWAGPPALHSTFDFYIDNLNVVLGRQLCTRHSIFIKKNLNVELGRQLCTRHSNFTKTIWMLCWAASSALDIRFKQKQTWMLRWAASSALDIRFLQRQSECWAGPPALHSTFDFYKDNLNVVLGC